MQRNSLIHSLIFLLAVFVICFNKGCSRKCNVPNPVEIVEESNKVNKILESVSANTFKVDSAPLAIFDQYVETSYYEAGLAQSGLTLETYREAVTGYHNIMSANSISFTKPLITIIDFNQSSKSRRLWVINLATNQVVYNTWVAHGKGSGGEYVASFSNTPDSYQSSLGFFTTQNTYVGKHGTSLKLEGLDHGFNTNAWQRSIVVHGAAYANADVIKVNGRLGRSQGCPALPLNLAQPIINTIKNKTVLYIDGPSKTYFSSYLDVERAALCFSADKNGQGHLSS